MDPIIYHKQTLDVIAQLCRSGKINNFSKRITIQRRRDLEKFIDEANLEKSKELNEFLYSYDNLLESINNRLLPQIFQLILKIGIRFKEKDDDEFWFTLMTTMDYGSTFDEPQTLQLLVKSMVLSDNNSWKAACMLCILIQDYPNMKLQVSRELMRIPSEILPLLRNIEHYTLSIYVVELLSQLENEELVRLIFGREEKIPVNCYANDSACVQFLSSGNSLHSSIFMFECLSIGDEIESTSSICQVTSGYFIVFF